MRICFVGPANNRHIEKWCKYFVSKHHEVHVVSLVEGSIESVVVHYVNTGISPRDSDIKKLKYLLYPQKVKKIIKNISPDIISVHYATSYGLLVALALQKGYFLSVWGSDIYEFPKRSFLHKEILKFSLRKASILLSTSKAMAEEASKYTNKEFYITPFGVDINLFNPDKRNRAQDDNKFVIGNIKTLDPKYGIDYLLKAAALFHKKHPECHFEVRIGGKGPAEEEYKKLAESLGIKEIVTWLGYISQENVAQEWANMDIAIVYSSASESFGVSAVEAESCGIPVIISDVPGLMEATLPNVSSLVVKRKSEKDLAETIEKLYFSKERRNKMGKAGRKYVVEKYEINYCFEYINNIFNNVKTNLKYNL